jgi:hypothetical protein
MEILSSNLRRNNRGIGKTYNTNKETIMNQQDYQERIRKREQRAAYREKLLNHEQEKREWKQEREAYLKRINEAIPKVFREDNKKTRKHEKKPGAEIFINLYSYIAQTAFDKRDSIPSNWKPSSFNVQKQHFEFLKTFVYPYPLPETLVWATHTPEYISNDEGGRAGNAYYGLIRLAKRWINDITGGGSFYKKNTKFFTRAEAHYFLNSKVPYEDFSSIIKLYFYAKCRAKAINPKLSMITADVFHVKFLTCFKHRLVESFLDLIARTPEYRYDSGTIGDLCDFVFSKIRERKNGSFSFSGRTIFSVIKLCNEWHEQVRKEAEQARRMAAMPNGKPGGIPRWKGLGISRFRYETEDCVWVITELTSVQDLVNEGRKMKNCVGNYANKCASGNSAVFSVERINKVNNQLIENAATLEVNVSNRMLIQAKGKCNAALPSKTMNVIDRWAASNRIIIKLLA